MASPGDSNNSRPSQLNSGDGAVYYPQIISLDEISDRSSHRAAVLDNRSDYGSDFDTDGEEAVHTLLTDIEAAGGAPLVLENLEEDVTKKPNFALVPLFSSQGSRKSVDTVYHSAMEGVEHSEARIRIEYDFVDQSSGKKVDPKIPNTAKDAGPASGASAGSEQPQGEESVVDSRSPLERFRKPPRKPLSVTDLVSPAWCELQYWYTLTKHGRKKRTPAMKQGSKIHQKMEDEVHVRVPVEVTTKEDAFGLNLWNTIQGLRTLRTTGMTRELGVMDVIEGEVVMGVVDEVSQTCPDMGLEDTLTKSLETVAESQVQHDQKAITDFFPGGTEKSLAWLSNSQTAATAPSVYLTDLKTRMSKTLPSGDRLRPVQMQLMLYRRMLVSMATNQVSADTIFERYGLDSKKTFTSTFIDEIAALDGSAPISSSQSDDDTTFNAAQAFPTELQTYNNLNLLWSLMIQECAETIPSAENVGTVLAVQYLWQEDGQVLATRSFAYDQEILDTYVKSEMSWWKGEREAQGVPPAEAWKCRTCEFAEDCTWRAERVELDIMRARKLKKQREAAKIRT